MSNTLADILANRQFDEPEEIQVIKEFVRESFKSNVVVQMGQSTIIIITASAGLAGSLRPHLHTLKKLCNTDKKLLIRIG